MSGDEVVDRIDDRRQLAAALAIALVEADVEVTDERPAGAVVLDREAGDRERSRHGERLVREGHIGARWSALEIAGGVEADAVERVAMRLAVGQALVRDRRMVVPIAVGRAGRDGIGADLLVSAAIDRDIHLEIGDQSAAGIAAGDVESEGSGRGVERAGVRAGRAVDGGHRRGEVGHVGAGLDRRLF